MDYTTNFIMLTIFFVVSFVVKKWVGFDLRETWGLVGLFGIVISFVIIGWPIISSAPDGLSISIERLTTWLVNHLPGAAIGDWAGAMATKITGEGS